MTSTCVFRSPESDADKLSSAQVNDYLALLSSRDLEVFKSKYFADRAAKALAASGATASNIYSGQPLATAVLACLSGELLQLQNAMREEFANPDALSHVVAAFGRSSDGVSREDFADFVRFCIAYRIHCYFETSRVVAAAHSGSNGVAAGEDAPKVVFVLGGPGAGKGTQCARISETFGYAHLSAGDLLREERKRPGSQYGELIENYIKEGKLVPGEITINLIKQAMEQQGWKGGKYLIDGFPRSEDNLDGWNKIMAGIVNLKFAVFFDCSEECMEARLLERGKTSGRADDNIETIKKRFKTFQTDSLPVLKKLDERGLVRRISAEQTQEEVWQCVRRVFGPQIVFVLGGPGAGKGTQCSNISENFGYKHLSAGDLLREERSQPNSKYGALIDEHIKEGKLVPADIPVKLMLQAMEKFGWEGGRYLIDGFPRSFDNLSVWNATVGEQVIIKFALYFECSEGVMEGRLLERGKTSGRADDNIESIRKRFMTFRKESMPVIEKFESEGVLRKMNAEKSTDEVWRDVKLLFGPTVIYVLGGPGAGKGTQCARISQTYGYTHLSAGDLLREERKRPGSEVGALIESYIKEGKLVPVEIVVRLIGDAMKKAQWEGGKYLVDGFPRSFDNLEGWNKVLGDSVNVRFSLCFDCPESVMEARLLERGKTSGRSDDNIEAIRKRFRTFQEESRPVLEHLAAQGSLRRIDSTQHVEAVWADVQKHMNPVVAFVIGGPGAGKKTQCQRIATQFGFQHISVGDMCRNEPELASYIMEGKLVPPEKIVTMLNRTMERRGWDGGKFLVEGFPRNLENLECWNKMMGSKTWLRLALHLDCPDSVREERMLERGKKSGRSDDADVQLIKKRNQTFEEGFQDMANTLLSQGLLRRVDATQDIEDVWQCTREIVSNNLGVHVQNYAMLLIKPHANNKEVERFVQSHLTTRKVAVVKKGTVPAQDLVGGKNLFDKQYFQIVNNATVSPGALVVPTAGQEKFKQAEGVAWLEALEKGDIVSGMDAGAKLGLTNVELLDAWNQAKMTKLAGSMYIGKVEGKGSSCFVVNGFVPAWRDSFGLTGSDLAWFVVDFSPANVTWKQFRDGILGTTNPAKAAKESMRAQLYEHWQAMGLKEQPNTTNNCLHASAGPLEGLRERMLWTGVSLDSDPFGRMLRASGIPAATIEAWLQNAEVYGWQAGCEVRGGPIFDCTETCDSGEVRDSAVKHLLGQGAKPDIWTVKAVETRPRTPGQMAELATAAGPPPDKMTILHFNDVYNVEPRAKEPVGGIARFVTKMRELRADAVTRGEPEAVVLFSGDAFNPSLTSTTTMGKHMIPALNAIGIHTACYGNHDFDFGVDNLVDLASQNNFPWLVSNVTSKATGRPLADGMISRMMNFHGRKVGLIGLVEKEWLVTLATLDPSEVDFEEFCPCARRLAKQLKEQQGAEIVIALTHMRVPNDELLAHEVEEVDIILGGHDHHYDVKPVGPHETYVLKSGTDFRDITTLTLDFTQRSAGGKRPFKVVDTQHVEIVASIKEDPEMKVFVDECMAKLGAAMDTVIGETAVDLDCRFASIRTMETNVSNFVADVMKHALKADIGALNSGTLRADAIIEKGPIRMRDLVNLLPMLDELCLLQLSGAQVMAVLENACSQYPRLEGRFLAVSGVRYTFDAAKPGGQRVVEGSVTIGGELLDMSKLYKLTTKDYLRQGKDGYDVFRDCVCLADGEQAGILPSMIRDFFQELATLNGDTDAAGADATKRAAELMARQEPAICLEGDGPAPLKRYMICPKIEGRITCLNPVQ